jgi:hypothetical protein
MLSNYLAGVAGAFTVMLIQAVIDVTTKRQRKKDEAIILAEAEKLGQELDEIFQQKAEFTEKATQNMFQPGDFLKTKPVELQPWEKTAPPEVMAEVLEVGKGAYLMNVSMPGYQTVQTTIPFTEAHYMFIKDTTRRAKPVLKIVKDEVVN